MKFKYFSIPVLFLLILAACSPKYYNVEQTEERRIFITDTISSDATIDSLISPYRAQMIGELERVLSYAPMDLNLNGPNSSLGNLVADAMLKEGNVLFTKSHPDKKIDIALMNRGGLRRTFSAGNLSVRSIYELMPFENELVVVTLSGQTVYKMVQFLRESDRNHPIAGIKFIKNTADKNFYIGTQPFDENKDYYVLTNDYVQKGGSNMEFFKEAKKVEYLNLKLRDMFIHHFEKIDTIRVNMDPRYLD